MNFICLNHLKKDTRLLKRSWWCAILIWGWLAQAETVAAEETMFVGELILQEDQWDYWLEERTVLHIEGRYHSITGKILKLEGCDLNFRAGPTVRYEKSKTVSRQIRLTGRMVPYGDGYEFQVDNYLHLPFLTEQIQKRLKEKDISEVTLYSLARKVREQADFYDDPKLEQSADQLLHKAVQTERDSFIALEPEQLWKLGQKAKRLEASPDLWEPMLHEALRRQWKEITNRTRQQKLRDELTARLAKLPGAEIPLEDYDPKLEKKYRQQPVKIYNESDPFTRMELHRLFFMEVIEDEIVKRMNVDKSNGAEIAAELEETIPERIGSQQTLNLRLAGVEFKFKHVETATRSEMLELAEELRNLGQPEKSIQAMQRWFDQREERVRKEGPAAAPQLADDIIQYLHNQNRAEKLLLDAVKQAPDSREITMRLDKFGFIKVQDEWVKEKDYRRKLDNDPLLKAMRQGVVIEGMTLEQVQRTLGRPTQHVKAVSDKMVTEVWVFPQGADQFLSVYFERERLAARKTAKVKKIIQPQ